MSVKNKLEQKQLRRLDRQQRKSSQSTRSFYTITTTKSRAGKTYTHLTPEKPFFYKKEQNSLIPIAFYKILRALGL